MTADFDTLLRETLHDLADRAPDETRVRAALQPRRPRLPLVVAAAAVLLVAVAVPVLRAGGEGGAPPARFAIAAPRAIAVPLTATWLPEGVVEGSRTAAADGSSITRIWYADLTDSAPSVALTLAAVRPDPREPTGAPVDLGAMGFGTYRTGSDGTAVSWSLGEWGFRMSAPPTFLDGPTVLDVARGLRDQPPLPLRTAVEFGDLGAGMTESYTVSIAERGARVHSVSATADFGVPVPLTADVTPVDPGLTGTPVTVRGHPATVDQAGTMVAVDLGDRWLVVRAGGQSALLRIAEGMAIGPMPANDWLGR